VWDAKTGQELNAFKGRRFLAFSWDGQRLAAEKNEGQMVLCDARSGRNETTLQLSKGMILSASFSPDGKHMASADMWGKAKVWDAKTGEEILTLPGDVSRVCFNPDGTLIAGAVGTAITIWDAATGKEHLTLKGHSARIYGLCFSHEGRRIASGSKDGTVKVWDVAAGD
jgi:WD40 repeat protein